MLVKLLRGMECLGAVLGCVCETRAQTLEPHLQPGEHGPSLVGSTGLHQVQRAEAMMFSLAWQLGMLGA